MGRYFIYQTLNLRVEYWNIINNSVRVSKREEVKKRIGTTEDTKYLKFPNDSEGMSK